MSKLMTNEQLLKEVLKTCDWKEKDGLWIQPSIDGLWSSSDKPLSLNDAIHINNAFLLLMKMSCEEEKKYAVTESIQGEIHTGFKSSEEARNYVFSRLEQPSIDDDYEFKTVIICDEWSSGDLLPSEKI